MVMFGNILPVALAGTKQEIYVLSWQGKGKDLSNGGSLW